MRHDEDVRDRVSVGIATVVGYATAGAAAVAPLVSWLLTLDLPESVSAVLLTVAGVLVAVTGYGRQHQAAKRIESGGRVDPYLEGGDAGNVGPDGLPLIPDVDEGAR